jgi:hypothetical protein
MRDEGVKAKARVEGIIDRIDSMRCSNDSYRKSFVIRYDDYYRNNKGELVHVNMYQNVECYNEVARKVREFSDGDYVMLVGRLKSLEKEHFTLHYIEVEDVEDIIKLPEEI